ncbi:MAG TPA: Shedu anti-phage system protein SduA domain-containing protein [Actinocrinis sp.]|uniref:Shedu anti-phage system protein SduA domain-containing protein n=1 Tax=Actinocrinis sp. TaxID=1920516 RepID=UPI002DDCA97E|nr:Shedu anti-phage system protein SduA domain-containing protein [Actinocrinis sp.]HEV2347050.1 Shedu anti-phage system protein SduA domain-containing protein [Actinocrinis sp.]
MRLWTFVTDGRRYAAQGVSAISLENVGDPVLLWRTSRGGGVVAVGSVVEKEVTVVSPRRLSLRSIARPTAAPEPAAESSRKEARAVYTDFCLSNPVSVAALNIAGLDLIVRAGRGGGSEAGRGSFCPLDLRDEQWTALLELLRAERAAEESPLLWPIAPGTVLYRSEVHDVFGGPRGWAECSSTRTMNDLLFVDRRPDDPELIPTWDEDVLRVAGQAADGDTQAAVTVIRHLDRGRVLRVFEARGELCQYIGEFVVDQGQAVERRVDAGRRMVYPRWRGGPQKGGVLSDFKVPILRIRQLAGIEAFRGLSDPFDRASPVKLGLTSSPHAAQPEQAAGPPEMASTIRGLIELVERDPATALSLEGIDAAEALHTLVQRRRREADLDRLRAAVADPRTLEGELQKLLEGMLWLFGGGFLPTGGRRMLTTTDQLDLSLIRPDGSLHGVEIKRARIQPLMTMHRDYPVFGHEVYKAVAQAMNYLTRLDQQRDRILLDHGIDAQRATMSVLIGSAIHAAPYGPEKIAKAVRIHNAGLSRIQIITYDQLIDEAQGLISGSGNPAG